MHVAVCDDNVADRKQFERLIKRESDKRAATTGIVYADSFGTAGAMLANPRQYDVFYIDLCHTPNVDVCDVINSLEKKGVTVPIFLCCSETDYRQIDFPEHVFFLDKPIKVADLSESLDRVEELLKKAPTLIELRDLKDTIYVHAEEILYARANGRTVTVTFTDGHTFDTISDIDNLLAQWEIHACFVPANMKLLLNANYVTKIRFGRVHMTNGASFSISHSNATILKSLLEQR